MLSVRNQQWVRPLAILYAFQDGSAVDGSEAKSLDTLEYRTRFLCSLHIRVAEIRSFSGILLLNRCFVPFQLVIVYERSGFVLNNQEWIIVNLGPNVDIFPLATDVNAGNVEIGFFPSKKRCEVVPYVMQLWVCPGELRGRLADQPGKHGILRQLRCREREDVWRFLSHGIRCDQIPGRKASLNSGDSPILVIRSDAASLTAAQGS